MRGKEDRTIVEMIRDELVLDRIESWGEWNFLAKGVRVEKEECEDVLYDVVTVDMENRRIQADIIGYNSTVKNLLQDAVDELDGQYGYIAPNVSKQVTQQKDFPPEPVQGETYWTEEEAWMLETAEFQDVTDCLFGYDPRDRYERIESE